MQFSQETHRLLLLLLAAFGLVAVTTTYWAVTGPETILTREDNPRLVEQQARLLRGQIVDREGEILVNSYAAQGGIAVRDYLYPAMNSALGYYSMRYGTAGAEAAYDIPLSGIDRARDLAARFEESVLHRPPRGTDVRLTFDLAIQQAAAQALGDRAGAVVVMRVPDGAISAMVSQPTYDPNTLNANWEQLAADPGEPFFNRALQGNYQPGGTIYPLLITAALIEQFPVETIFDEADRPVRVAGVTLTCINEPPADRLTLFDAFTFGCPAPFLEFAQRLGLETVRDALALFRPEERPTLPGFITEPQPESIVQPIITPEPEGALPSRLAFGLDDALGQGEFQFTPLELASITAALINRGNIPQPYTLLAVRPPDEKDWQPVLSNTQSTPVTTTENARRLQSLLRQNVVRGTAHAAARDDLDIGGTVAVSYSGETSNVWFAGFVRLDATQGYTVVVLLEDSGDVELAAAIGGDVLAAAAADTTVPPASDS
ncbi:MAG: penicillin-binding transpeptidase domain-containing protein [Phototrophicaceae bacterium]